MLPSNQQPDLDDSINVAEAHGRVVREAAACAREKRIADNGREPISLWTLVACGVVAVIAGGILGGAGNWFSYATIFRDGYVRTPAPGAGEDGPKAKEALAAFIKRGEKIYTAKCNGCHMSDAKGDGANFPTLVGSTWVTGDTDRFAMIILNGLQGPISNGKAYGVMPSQGSGLSPEDLAGVMTYVRNHFGNATGDVVSVEMAKAAMDISAKRAKVGQPMSAEELNADHAKSLPGDPLDPKLLVDPITLAPVAASTP
jgi:mono/diheme cytochrome c family protein